MTAREREYIRAVRAYCKACRIGSGVYIEASTARAAVALGATVGRWLKRYCRARTRLRIAEVRLNRQERRARGAITGGASE